MKNRYCDQPMPGRRNVLKAALGAGVTLAAGNSLWCSAVSAALVPPSGADRAATGIATPFDAAEIAILASIVEAIVPTGATAGARETGSVQFVLATVRRYGEAAIAGTRQALLAVDQIARAQFGRGFAMLGVYERDAIVGLIAIEPAFAVFWNTVRSLSVLHFYAQPEGYRPIGLPGPNIDRGGYPQADIGREYGCIKL